MFIESDLSIQSRKFPFVQKACAKESILPDSPYTRLRYLCSPCRYSILYLSWCRCLRLCLGAGLTFDTGLLCCSTAACHKTFYIRGNPCWVYYSLKLGISQGLSEEILKQRTPACRIPQCSAGICFYVLKMNRRFLKAESEHQPDSAFLFVHYIGKTVL